MFSFRVFVSSCLFAFLLRCTFLYLVCIMLHSSLSVSSLSALADVLGALSEQRSHIPYRNTRLTHMLSDTIGRFGVFSVLRMICHPSIFSSVLVAVIFENRLRSSCFLKRDADKFQKELCSVKLCSTVTP